MSQNGPTVPGQQLPIAVPVELPQGSTHDTVVAHAVRALYQALEARDPYTAGHSTRVAHYAVQIAAELGLEKSEQNEIRLASELHDIGKIGVSDTLLRNDGPLSRDEYLRVLQHTLIGVTILTPLFENRRVVLGVARWHHERFDGSGYPDRLRGECIPLAARIVAVADAYDAMRSTRSYRAALPAKVAAWELANGAGRQFDPACVAALLAVLGRGQRDQKRALRGRHRSGRPGPSRQVSTLRIMGLSFRATQSTADDSPGRTRGSRPRPAAARCNSGFG